MSQIEDLNAVQEALAQIPLSEVKDPNMPPEIAVQEAEDQYETANKYREQLTAAGLPTETIDALKVSAGALREAESQWYAVSKTDSPIVSQWKELSAQGYQLHKKLSNAFRYAYRKDAKLMSSVRAILKGSGDNDLIQDLNDFAVLGKAHPAPLETIKYSLDELDTAALLSDQLGELKAKANGTKVVGHNETLALRDRAFTYMKTQLDEVRDCGKYVFADQPEIRKLFTSAYMRKKASKAKKANTENTETEE